MKLATWASLLSILTSSVVIVGAKIVRTEPRVLRTLPPTLPSARPVEPWPRILEPSAGGPWRPFEATGYAIGCTMTLSGIEPNHKLAASGVPLAPNWSVAAHREFPFGTVLELSHGGILTTRIVHDRGRMIGPGKLDLAFEDCNRARRFGRRTVWAREVRRPLGGDR